MIMPKYAATNTPTDKPNQNIPTIYYEFFQKLLNYALLIVKKNYYTATR